MYRITVTAGRLPDSILATLQADEAAGAGEVSAREETNSIAVFDAKGAPIAYAVFGWDLGDMVVVYYARSMVPGLGPLMMKQFFGVAQILGAPLRMHAQSVRDIAVKARMFGATVAVEGIDGDGILQGVFNGV